MSRGFVTLLAMLSAAVAVGCASGSAPSLTAKGQSSSPAARATTIAARPLIPGSVTARLVLHDSGGRGDLTVVTSVDGAHEGGCWAQGHLRIVDSSGTVNLRRDWTYGCGYIAANKPSTDATGNVFLTYNPGRYDGVIVLRAVNGTILSFGTLPDSGDTGYLVGGDRAAWGYYANTVRAQGNDLEIEKFDNNCTPSCAYGTITHRFYAWNGTKYVPRPG